MGLFDKKPPRRGDLLERAAKARSKKKHKKAIGFYRKALELNPDDHDVLAKLAASLAETRQETEALATFIKAAKGYQDKGFVEKAAGVYQQATRYLPTNMEVWERLATLNIERSRTIDAQKVLVDGSQHFFKKPLWPKAIRLLRQAFDLQPWEYKTTYGLAYALKKTGAKNEAQELLAELATRVRRRRLRQVRGLLFRMSPNPANAFRWLRAALAGR